MKDPNPSVKGGGIEFLRANGVEVVVGVLESEAQRQNEIFIKYVKTGMPFVMVKCAATLDGRIATRSGDSKWVSSGSSRQFVHQLRDQVDGILVGKNTVLLDNPSLTTRLPGKDGKDPHRIILDTHLDIPETSALLHLDSTAETFIFTGPEIANEKRSRLEKSGARILTSPLADGRVDLVSVMKTLGELGITSVLVEGGSRIIGAAFSSGLVDKLYFFYSPKILGGNDGVPITWGKGKGQMRDCLNVTDIQLRRFENDILIEGYVNG
jgi:diaminohydroxyphosphoribosylaminopyrimidine deaminase/5-amino-6-(5-phosphoribosylamino)uracil reductase